MVSLNIPDELYRKIEDLARQVGQTPSDQARELLERALGEDVDQDKLLDEIRRDRDALAAKGVHINDEMLREAKNWGRE